jgi:hypothetical protein
MFGVHQTPHRMSEDSKKAREPVQVRNPALQQLDEMNSAEWAGDTPTDVAVNHDRYLAEAYAEPSVVNRLRRGIL